MNKIINIFITLIFLTSFIGVQVNKHYSHGKLYSIAFFSEAENCCSENSCDMDMHSSCNNQSEDDCSCKDKSEFMKINNVFMKTSFSNPKISFTSLFLLENYTNNKIIQSAISSKNKFYFFAPPEIDKNFCSELGVFIC